MTLNPENTGSERRRTGMHTFDKQKLSTTNKVPLTDVQNARFMCNHQGGSQFME